MTAQELQWGVAVEGALTIDDLLDRRTRLGLVAEDREASQDAAAAAFERAGVEPVVSASSPGGRVSVRLAGIRSTTSDRREPMSAATARLER